MKKKIEEARLALVQAKSAFDANPNDATASAVESKSAEFSELVSLAERVSAAEGMKALTLDGDVQGEGGGRLAGSVVQKFLDSAEYKHFAESGSFTSNSEKSISLPSVRLGGYSEVLQSKAALTTAIAHPEAVRYPMVDLTVKPELTLMDLVHTGKISGDSLQYVQVTAVERNAALQPENTGNDVTDTLKPLSDMSTNLETAHVFGYADGYTVTTQMLSDAAAFASFMDSELRTSVRAVQEHYLLHGTGTNGEPRGILNTTGIQQLTFDDSGSQPIRNLVNTVRSAIGKVRKAGGSTTAILLSAEDNEAIDLMEDANGGYLFGGPASNGVDTLWGRRRVVSDELEQGQVLLGEWSQISYLDRDGISVEAFNQHADYARRNLVYVRSEARGLQAFWRPARIALIEAA